MVAELRLSRDQDLAHLASDIVRLTAYPEVVGEPYAMVWVGRKKKVEES